MSDQPCRILLTRQAERASHEQDRRVDALDVESSHRSRSQRADRRRRVAKRATTAQSPSTALGACRKLTI
jgi:hypothetical protein